MLNFIKKLITSQPQKKIKKEENCDSISTRSNNEFPNLNSQLCSACEKNDIESVRKWLSLGAEVNSKVVIDDDLTTPLNIAVDNRQRQIVRLLLEYGAEPDFTTVARTPLETSCLFGNPDPKLVELLLDAGAKPSVCALIEIINLSSGYHDERVKIISMLLEKGVSPNSFHRFGNGTSTPFQSLIESIEGDALTEKEEKLAREDLSIEIATLLLSHGLDPRYAPLGWSPLELTQAYNLEKLETLLKNFKTPKSHRGK